ncbi:hypothetical protein EV13_0966 [Prochlorococcus sp. MIT 0702]|nr:hypothetical protein EV12_0413 [Prochlorococcus sp. MIT 0701]KGG29748.1 hypothetical protein EV13_0966 [Prochlorococcus sp. MIT 0702]KGG34304.1 hypothetical protein EV14_1398 [Prochlorococcus sp. MIT 0703]
MVLLGFVLIIAINGLDSVDLQSALCWFHGQVFLAFRLH